MNGSIPSANEVTMSCLHSVGSLHKLRRIRVVGQCMFKGLDISNITYGILLWAIAAAWDWLMSFIMVPVMAWFVQYSQVTSVTWAKAATGLDRCMLDSGIQLSVYLIWWWWLWSY